MYLLHKNIMPPTGALLSNTLFLTLALFLKDITTLMVSQMIVVDHVLHAQPAMTESKIKMRQELIVEDHVMNAPVNITHIKF